MSVLDAVEVVLKAEGKPLHYTGLTRRILERGLWQTDGKTPEATVNARLSVHINQHGPASPFQRTGPGVFALRAWNLPEPAPKPKSAGKKQPGKVARVAQPVDSATPAPDQPSPSPPASASEPLAPYTGPPLTSLRSKTFPLHPDSPSPIRDNQSGSSTAHHALGILL